MAYIGKQPVVGNFQKCDAISVVNGQAAYSLTVGSAAVSPENVNHMLVSLNGVLQAPGDSFTVSGSTLTFASNLATGDVIDFVIILGDVLDLGTPSDNSISTAKLVANSVTAAKFNADVISGQTALASAPADTDEFLVSDAGVLKRIDYSLIKGGGMFEFISSTDISSSTSQVDFTSLSTDYSDFKVIVQNLRIGNDNQNLELRYFNNSGTIIDGSNYMASYHGYVDGSETASTTSGQDRLRLSPPIGNADHETANAEVTVFNVHETGGTVATEGWKHALCHMSFAKNDGNIGVVQSAGLTKENNSGNYAISGLRFFMSGGNIESGRFSLYGRKHS